MGSKHKPPHWWKDETAECEVHIAQQREAHENDPRIVAWRAEYAKNRRIALVFLGILALLFAIAALDAWIF